MNEIVVLGAGYTGMTAALSVAARRRDAHVTLVNPQARFTERLRLHQIASGQELADLEIPAMLEGTGIDFIQGWVTGMDADRKEVRVDDERTLRYDTLVYAVGSVADTSAVPGVDEHAYTLNSAHDATLLAARLGQLTEGTVVVAGSGLTGVEAAAEIAEQHPNLTVVLAGRQEPGIQMGPKARAYLHASLDRLGVRVRAGVDIRKVLPDAVSIGVQSPVASLAPSDELIPADAVLWTTGVRVSPLAGAAGLTVDERGRIVTDAALRSVSHPDVYAVGDAAAVTQPYGIVHGTCQSGIPTAAHAARNIARTLKGKQPIPFRFGYLHQPVSLGRQDAVIQFTRPDDSPGRFLLRGRLAVAYKETVSASPWKTYGMVKTMPRVGTLGWRRGGQA